VTTTIIDKISLLTTERKIHRKNSKLVKITLKHLQLELPEDWKVFPKQLRLK
jgi:hypothetical protein